VVSEDSAEVCPAVAADFMAVEALVEVAAFTAVEVAALMVVAEGMPIGLIFCWPDCKYRRPH
jgi:hypothetical protein